MRQTVALSGHLMTVERNLVLATAAASEGATSADVLHAIDPDHGGAILWQHVLEGAAPSAAFNGDSRRTTATFRPHCPISSIKLKQSAGTTGTKNPLNFAKQ